jgi:dephospho-CoA kinase
MNFVFIVGPPAVGKMTVGEQLAEKLDYKLFHNHYSIELALSLYPYGTEEYRAINEGIRQLVFKTAAASSRLKGLIFTLVWAFNEKEDWQYVEDIKKIFEPYKWEFYFVELYAPIDVRLERNRTPHRLSRKASKRDLESSERGILENEESFQMNTDGSGIGEDHYLFIDNSALTPQAVAEQVIRAFRLAD